MRTTRSRSKQAPAVDDVKSSEEAKQKNIKEEGGDEEDYPQQVHIFEGVEYDSYQEMVNAKRKRNQEVLRGLGLGSADNSLAATLNKEKAAAKAASRRGISSQKKQKVEILPRKKSSRLSGEKTSLVSLNYYVANWNTDNSVVKVTGEGQDREKENNDQSEDEKEPSYFKGRLNDGSDLSLEQAIELNDKKWIANDSVEASLAFQKELCQLNAGSKKSTASSTSPRSVLSSGIDTTTNSVESMVQNLSTDNEEWVAKVTPDRIYSVASHPSESKMIACAGDKRGYIGLWDVDSASESNNGVHLFHVHSRPVCCLDWLTSESMISASYDGTVRQFNVESGTFQEIFATYDDSDSYYAEELGFGLDKGYNYWIQYVTADHRYTGSNNPSLFLSTSAGTAMHIDLRVAEKQRITFNESLSEKKINSLSFHPDGYTLASAGLDCTVNLWDIRKFGSKTSKKVMKPFASQSVGRSVNSAFFSPSGESLLTTSMADRLDLIEHAHTQSGKLKPTTSIRHNNQTGRWLTTFMAAWHPSLDIFTSGSMAKPRCIESFDSSGQLLRAVTGESLASVMSRCCYHRSTEKLAIIGGNSSGRVVVIR